MAASLATLSEEQQRLFTKLFESLDEDGDNKIVSCCSGAPLSAFPSSLLRWCCSMHTLCGNVHDMLWVCVWMCFCQSVDELRHLHVAITGYKGDVADMTHYAT